MDNIKPIHVFCQRILPLVYAESLSYYEDLCKFRNKLNEVIEWANSYQDELRKYVDAKYTELLNQMLAELQTYKNEVNSRLADQDSKIAGMQTQLDAIITQVQQMIDDNNAQIDQKIIDLENRTNQAIADMEAQVKAQIASLTAYVSAQIAVLYQQMEVNRQLSKDYTDVKIEELRNWLPANTGIMVRDPVDGKIKPIQDCLDNLYDALRYFGLTCMEYDTLNLTCGEYDAKGIMCWEYDRYGKQIFYPYTEPHYAYSEFTGFKVSVQQNLAEIYQYLRANGITCADYDALNLSAQDYDNKDITAYTYDWSGVPA